MATIQTDVGLIPLGQMSLLVSLLLVCSTPGLYRTNRGQRMYNFLDAFPADFGDTVDFITGIGHDTFGMAASESGLNRLL